MTWDTFYGPGPIAPEPAGRAAFRQAVAQAATALRQRYPQLTGRITKAVQIVLAGDIEPGEGGQFTVGSQSDAGLYFVINGECACKDSDRPEIDGRCKHVLATAIFQQAYAQTAQTLAQRDTAQPNPHPTFEDVVEESVQMQNTPAPTMPALPAALTLNGAVMTEAPYSVNVKVSQGGYTFQLTIRKGERTALLDAMNGLPEWLDAHGYQPAEQRRNADMAKATDTPAATEAPRCRYHGTQNMQPSKFGEGRFVCSVKLADGSYCNQTYPTTAKG
jgi:hypothetical protein